MFNWPTDLETKDDDGTGGPSVPASATDSVEIKNLVDSYMNTITEGLKKTVEQKGGKGDVLLEEKERKIETQMAELETEVKKLRAEASRPLLGGDVEKQEIERKASIEYKAWNNYVRHGLNPKDMDETKDATLGSDPDGGYLAPAQVSSEMDRIISEVSPIRQIARVMSITGNSLIMPTTTAGASSGWVGESDARAKTSTPQIDNQEYPTKELYAKPIATQTLLDDANVNIEQWLAGEVQIQFAEQEGNAFVNGNGIAQPRGILQYDKVANANWTWGKTGYTATGASGAFKTASAGDDAANLVDLVYSIKAAFRQNSRFLMNRNTLAQVRKMRDADGNFHWRPGLIEGQPDRILGYAITEAEDMPDIGANTYAIAFGDFQRGYLIVDRMGVRVLRDPYSSKPYIEFYTTKRVGGGMKHYDAIKLMKFGTT